MPLLLHEGFDAHELITDELTRSRALEILGMWRCRFCKHYNEPNEAICNECGGSR